MMRQVMFALAASASLGLAACNQGSGPELPKTEDGATAPSDLSGPSGGVDQANLTPDQRRQLEELIVGYLDGYQNSLAQGKSRAPGFNDEIAGLQPGTDHRWQVNLNGGTAYRILGACDNECSNVDIELIDSRGGVVASDTLPDDYPVVDYTPSANGVYYVRIMMQTCTIAPCYAGARILQ